jgi:hypothetical protein
VNKVKKKKSKNKNVRLALYSRYIKRVFDESWEVISNDNKVIIKKRK